VLWQESELSIPLGVLSRNVYTRMIERTYNNKKEILDAQFKGIVKDEIASAKKIKSENPDNNNLVQLESPYGVYLLPFPFFIPEESFRHGSFKYTEDGNKLLEDRFEDMELIFGKNIHDNKTVRYSPTDQTM
jgi:hypothetical protein